MKKFLYIILLALTAFVSCKKNEDTPSTTENPPYRENEDIHSTLCGEWRSSGLSIETAVYVSFLPDGTFELYQKMENKFELRRGTWNLEGDLLSGKYNDGEDWAADYKISVNGNKLTMVSQNEGAETNIYVQCAIPAGIKENCIVVVKSVWL